MVSPTQLERARQQRLRLLEFLYDHMGGVEHPTPGMSEAYVSTISGHPLSTWRDLRVELAETGALRVEYRHLKGGGRTATWTLTKDYATVESELRQRWREQDKEIAEVASKSRGKRTTGSGVQISDETLAEIRRLKDEGLTVQVISSRIGVSQATIAKYTSPKESPDSGRNRILRAIAENGPIDVSDLMDLNPDVDGHATVHLVYSLSKAGLARFRESRARSGGNGVELERITATKRGFQYLGMSVKPVHAALGDRNAQSIHPGDGSDYRNQPSVAPGGPVTRTYTTPEPKPPKEPKVEHIFPVPDHEIVIPEPVTYKAKIVVLPTYPVISALFERKTQLEQAATLLEQAGQDELALAVLGKADEFTPLEKEAMQIYNETMRYAE